MSEFGEYPDLRIREVKLKSARAASSILASAMSIFLIICVLAIVLVLLAILMVSVLNTFFGEPMGALVVFVFFLVLLLVLCLLRKKLFRKTCIRQLLGDEGIRDEKDLELQIVKTEAKIESCANDRKWFSLALRLVKAVLKH